MEDYDLEKAWEQFVTIQTEDKILATILIGGAMLLVFLIAIAIGVYWG